MIRTEIHKESCRCEDCIELAQENIIIYKARKRNQAKNKMIFGK